METRANYALIGLFTLCVLAGGFLFVYWFSMNDRGAEKRQVRVVFSGSVSGLSRGSAVLFNGLRVGEVTEISLLPDDPRRVTARIDVDGNTPLRADTRARLEYQGLTGVAQVSLSGGSPDAAPLVAQPGQPRPTIIAERSDFQDLLESARSIATKADEVLDTVNRVFKDNAESVSGTVQNVERFSKALGDNAPAIDNFLAQVGQAAEKIGPLAEKLEVLSQNVNTLVSSVDPKAVSQTVANVQTFTQTLADSRAQVNAVLDNAASLTQRLNQSTEKLDGTLNDVSTLVKAVDPQRVNAAVANVETFSKVLADNRENVDRVITNAASLTERLNTSSVKLDTALADVSRLVNAVDPAKLDRTLTNVEGFTQTLNDNRQSVADIIAEVSRLTKAIDAERINQVVANAEKFTAVLGNASPQTEKVIANAVSLTDKLNKSADRVDGVLKAAEDFLGSAAGEEGKGLFEDIRVAANSIRVLADNLDKRTAEITSGINRFTGPGLQEYRQLAEDGRQTLNEIGRAVRSLERNPQQLLFGGKPNIPEYGGRR